jgi:hypothetical protein
VPDSTSWGPPGRGEYPPGVHVDAVLTPCVGGWEARPAAGRASEAVGRRGS